MTIYKVRSKLSEGYASGRVPATFGVGGKMWTKESNVKAYIRRLPLEQKLVVFIEVFSLTSTGFIELNYKQKQDRKPMPRWVTG